jgi:hypothetical protein
MERETLAQKIQKQEDHLLKVKKIMEMFPDVTEERDRWENIRLYSPSINAIADDAEIHHSCGCCADASLYVSPFKIIEGIQVYSKPAHFCIGHKVDFGTGDEVSEDWENQLKEENIGETAIAKVREYVRENKPRYYTLEGEEDE